MKRILIAAALSALAASSAVQAAEGREAYAGSAECRRCHEKFHERWITSWHGRALQPFSRELAERSLTASPAVRVAGARGWMREGDREYEIRYAVGGKNVYYFLTNLERGHLQVMPLAYDVRTRTWIDAPSSMAMGQHAGGDAPVNWRDRMLTFNTSCFGCHVSQITAGYDEVTDSYKTSWLEPGINCETCHGPSAAHVRSPGLTNIIRLKTLSPARRNDACASCHAKLIPVAAGFKPGERFFDYYGLVALESDDYYPDGRDRRENYTYTSWLQAACARKSDLDCLHCHTSSGRYRFQDDRANDACLPCHEERVRNAAAHSHHAAGSVASRCVSCHMPKTEYARMVRTDHSLRPPSPAASIAYESPNACNGCHADKDASWSDRQVREWFGGKFQAEVLRRASLIASARKGDWSRLPEMLAALAGREGDEVFRASLIRLLEACRDERVARTFARAFDDQSALVRGSVVDSLAGRRNPDFAGVLSAAAKDDTRIVRIRAGAALSAWGVASPAVTEYMESLRSRRDDFAQRMNLGVLYGDAGWPEKALAEYQFAARLRPGYAPPLVNMALIFGLLGRGAEAERVLREAISSDPRNSAAQLNLGLVLAEAGRLQEAESALRKSLSLDSRNAAAAYNLAVIVSHDRLGDAIELCRQAASAEPDEPKYRAVLEYFLARQRAQ